MNSETFRKNIKQILIPEADLQAKIKEVGAQISKEYDGKPLLLVSILNGAFVFMADLCRAITIPCETAFMCAKSLLQRHGFHRRCKNHDGLTARHQQLSCDYCRGHH